MISCNSFSHIKYHISENEILVTAKLKIEPYQKKLIKEVENLQTRYSVSPQLLIFFNELDNQKDKVVLAFHTIFYSVRRLKGEVLYSD